MRLTTRKFTITESHQMSAIGILTPDERIELIEGEIIPMSPIGTKPAATVKRLNSLLNQQLSNQAIIGVQDPVKLDNLSEPQPDISILKMRSDFYEFALPKSEDILALIEVADSSIKYEQEVKIPLYAKSKIAEVWLVNLNNCSLEIYRNPHNQSYQSQKILTGTQTISFLAFPEITIQLTAIFG